jgi:hypothetical protein
MPVVVSDVFGLLGVLVRGIGFLIFGLGLGRFTLDAFKGAAWQVQIALALGLFGLLIALTDFASPGSAGMFALGAGIAYFMANMPKKADSDEEKK